MSVWKPFEATTSAAALEMIRASTKAVFASNQKVKQAVAEIFNDISSASPDSRLETIERYSLKFDATEAKSVQVVVRPQLSRRTELESAAADAIDMVTERVLAFHREQLNRIVEGWDKAPNGWAWKLPEGTQGGYEGQTLKPVKRAGAYVPGGLASYPSSVVMTVAPAVAAGVEDVIMATPPKPDGSVSPAVEYAAAKLGVKAIVAAGGSAGLVAMALGIEGAFEGVDVVAGPGNTYVNETKRLLWGKVGLDGFSGPSEVAVCIDRESQLEWAAADLATQVEHAPDNVGWVLADSSSTLDKFFITLESLIKGQPRESVIRKSLEGSFSICRKVESDEELALLIDEIAPEHVAIHSMHAQAVALHVRSAGSISIGPYSGQSLGDYVLGPSHAIPTQRGARYASPINVLTFMKLSSLSFVTKDIAKNMAPAAVALGTLEGLPLHAEAAKIRLN